MWKLHVCKHFQYYDGFLSNQRIRGVIQLGMIGQELIQNNNTICVFSRKLNYFCSTSTTFVCKMPHPFWPNLDPLVKRTHARTHALTHTHTHRGYKTDTNTTVSLYYDPQRSKTKQLILQKHWNQLHSSSCRGCIQLSRPWSKELLFLKLIRGKSIS